MSYLHAVDITEKKRKEKKIPPRPGIEPGSTVPKTAILSTKLSRLNFTEKVYYAFLTDDLLAVMKSAAFSNPIIQLL